jgi:hypothetical protein
MSGAKNSGQVSFAPMGNNATKVCLKLNYDPEGALENMADALGVVGRRVEGDLERFKKFIQTRRHERGPGAVRFINVKWSRTSANREALARPTRRKRAEPHRSCRHPDTVAREQAD